LDLIDQRKWVGRGSRR